MRMLMIVRMQVITMWVTVGVLVVLRAVHGVDPVRS